MSAPLWADPSPAPERPPLPGDRDADVCIIGAGFTGLWTAYYLRRADPTLRVVVLEAQTAGFGASGRNGGWCSALWPVGWERVATRHGREAAVRMAAALRETVDEVGRVCAEAGIDADYAKDGTLTLARSAAQEVRLRRDVEAGRRWDADLTLLPAAEAVSRVRAAGVRSAAFTPHCAAVHPGKLVRGLAQAAVSAGAVVHERTRVTAIRPGAAVTDQGTVRAAKLIRATEGYTPGLEGQHRALVPIYSLMVATAPLTPAQHEAVGWSRRETVTDGRHLIVYAQRTADGRIAFGGRGAPYHFGSRVRPRYDAEPRVFAALRHALVEMFPALADVEITHQWGGPLGVTRDWTPSVGLDPATGIGWAGGYVGDGVAASNLAGRTLADLVLTPGTDLTSLPWVGHRSRDWEPEPLRWLGANAMLRLTASADAAERRSGRPARRIRLVSHFTGG